LCKLYPGNFSCHEKCEFYCKNKKQVSFKKIKCEFCPCESSQNISYDNKILCKKCFHDIFGYGAKLINMIDVNYIDADITNNMMLPIDEIDGYSNNNDSLQSMYDFNEKKDDVY
jgi:hypothetical protein